MKQFKKIEGIIAPTFTPFNNDGSVNLAEYKKLNKYITQNGVNGVFVSGTSGEFINLSIYERRDMLIAAKESVTDGSKIIFNVTSMNLNEVDLMCQWARDIKVDAVTATAPYYYRYDEDTIVSYFSKIAELAYEIPFYLYNMSGMTGNPITTSIISRLSDKHTNICGIKDSSMDFMMILDYQYALKDRPFNILTGNDAQVLTTLLAGGDGGVIALAGVFPKICNEIYTKFKSKDLAGAKQEQEKIHVLRGICRDIMPIMSHKKMLEFLGFNMGGARFPMRNLTQNESDIIERTLKDLELI